MPSRSTDFKQNELSEVSSVSICAYTLVRPWLVLEGVVDDFSGGMGLRLIMVWDLRDWETATFSRNYTASAISADTGLVPRPSEVYLDAAFSGLEHSTVSLWHDIDPNS